MTFWSCEVGSGMENDIQETKEKTKEVCTRCTLVQRAHRQATYEAQKSYFGVGPLTLCDRLVGRLQAVWAP
jgi:hypothetical protein